MSYYMHALRFVKIRVSIDKILVKTACTGRSPRSVGRSSARCIPLAKTTRQPLDEHSIAPDGTASSRPNLQVDAQRCRDGAPDTISGRAI